MERLRQVWASYKGVMPIINNLSSDSSLSSESQTTNHITEMENKVHMF